MRSLFLSFLFVFPGFVFCQNNSFDDELKLANHLLNGDNNDEAIYHLKKTLIAYPGNQEKDTLNFLLGYAYYQQRQLEESTKYFLNVSPESASYMKARFTSIYNSLYNQNYSEANNLLNGLNTNNKLHSEYMAMQKAGLTLLNKNYEAYPNSSKEFSYSYFPVEKEQKELDIYYQDLISFKPKSMALAGVMSTVIPGTGKMYAGKLGEGVSAMLVVSILGAMTVENYVKRGLTNYKTITFGSLFTVFYLGNIYGSMVSVKVYRDEFYKTYERKILVNLHIPLRNIFY